MSLTRCEEIGRVGHVHGDATSKLLPWNLDYSLYQCRYVRQRAEAVIQHAVWTGQPEAAPATAYIKENSIKVIH